MGYCLEYLPHWHYFGIKRIAITFASTFTATSQINFTEVAKVSPARFRLQNVSSSFAGLLLSAVSSVALITIINTGLSLLRLYQGGSTAEVRT